MSDLKQGDKVWVSNFSEDDAVDDKEDRVFIVNYGGKDYCENFLPGGSLCPWKFAVKIPEPKIIPFTAETFPYGEVWINDAFSCNEYIRFLVHTVGVLGVAVDNKFIKYEELLEQRKISLDGGKTFQVAGIEESV